MKNSATRLSEKINRVIEIQKELDKRKELYTELDRLTLELQQLGLTEVKVRDTSTLEEIFVTIIDNFCERNTVFRPAGVKRFEVSLETAEARAKREARAAKKAGGS